MTSDLTVFLTLQVVSSSLNAVLVLLNWLWARKGRSILTGFRTTSVRDDLKTRAYSS